MHFKSVMIACAISVIYLYNLDTFREADFLSSAIKKRKIDGVPFLSNKIEDYKKITTKQSSKKIVMTKYL